METENRLLELQEVAPLPPLPPIHTSNPGPPIIHPTSRFLDSPTAGRHTGFPLLSSAHPSSPYFSASASRGFATLQWWVEGLPLLSSTLFPLFTLSLSATASRLLLCSRRFGAMHCTHIPQLSATLKLCCRMHSHVKQCATSIS